MATGRTRDSEKERKRGAAFSELASSVACLVLLLLDVITSEVRHIDKAAPFDVKPEKLYRRRVRCWALASTTLDIVSAFWKPPLSMPLLSAPRTDDLAVVSKEPPERRLRKAFTTIFAPVISASAVRRNPFSATAKMMEKLPSSDAETSGIFRRLCPPRCSPFVTAVPDAAYGPASTAGCR
ncbi:hypothetical protein MRX96_043998 [Rhipicephalus microplus]